VCVVHVPVSKIYSQAHVIHASAHGGPFETGLAVFGGGDSQGHGGMTCAEL
jgi:hypothetical protein